MAETKVFEDDQRIVWESVFGNWPDESGSRREVRVEWKPGTEGLAAQQAATNRTTVDSALITALAENKAFIASTPTAGTTATQVKALTRQMNWLIRRVLAALDATD